MWGVWEVWEEAEKNYKEVFKIGFGITFEFLRDKKKLDNKTYKYNLRRRLKEAKTGLKNQLGKLTEKPTLRWMFQCFQGIHPNLTLSKIIQAVFSPFQWPD